MSFVSPLQSAYLNQAAREQGVAARAREEAKKRKYVRQCEQHSVDFIPVVAETYGGWAKTAVETFERIIAAEATERDRPLGAVRWLLYGQLAVSIARNTAWAIIDRRPAVSVPEIHQWD